MKKAKFQIGPAQSFMQAWAAMQAGHLVRRKDWPTGIAYILDDSESMFGSVCFAIVNMNASPPSASQHTDNITAMDILTNDWEVLKKAWK